MWKKWKQGDDEDGQGVKQNAEKRGYERDIFVSYKLNGLYWQSLWKESVEKYILAAFAKLVVGPQKYKRDILVSYKLNGLYWQSL